MRKIDADRLKNDPYMKEFYQQLAIDNAPTVEEVTGEWILDDKQLKVYKCSKCGELETMQLKLQKNEMKVNIKNYCSNCGSKNREVE